MCSPALTPALACTSLHTGASFSSPHRGTFFFLLVKAFQAESSAQFRQTHQPVRVSPRLSLCREPHGSFLCHPFSTHLRNQMTQPLSLAHPGLRRQTTSQHTHSCSPFPAGPHAQGAEGQNVQGWWVSAVPAQHLFEARRAWQESCRRLSLP